VLKVADNGNKLRRRADHFRRFVGHPRWDSAGGRTPRSWVRL